MRFPVECRDGDTKLEARAAILGGGGILLEMAALTPVGAEMTLRFRPAKNLPYIKCKALVRYHLPGQACAFEFTESSADDRQVILKLVDRKKDERRKHPRVRLATQVQCETAMLLTYSRDVSEGGMFIETDTPLPPGSILTLRFNLDDKVSVMAKGVVTYQIRKFGMGVQFIEVPPEDKKQIEAYVDRGNTAPQNAKDSKGKKK